MQAISPSSSQQRSPKPMTANEVRERLTNVAIATIQEIARNNMERMKGFKNNISLLEAGPFYGNEYMLALKTMSQIERLDYFRKKGSFYHGYASPKYFTMLESFFSPSGIRQSCFVVKEGVKSSEALKVMRESLSFIGCGEACQIAYYEAIKEVLGTGKFDILFSPTSPTPLKIHLNMKHNPINALMKMTENPEKIEKGQAVSIINATTYPKKHYNGESGAYIAICSDETPKKESFVTLGLDPNGNILDEIKEKLRQAYNADPIGMEIVTSSVAEKIISTTASSILENMEKLKDRKLSLEEFVSERGGTITCSFELDDERIRKLAKSSIKNARRLFDQWQGEHAIRAKGGN